MAKPLPGIPAHAAELPADGCCTRAMVNSKPHSHTVIEDVRMPNQWIGGELCSPLKW